MDFDDKLSLTFSALNGATTFTGESRELDPFIDNDIDLIKRSASDKSYIRDSVEMLIEACDYFDRTPREELSISYLMEAGQRAHNLELEKEKQFKRNLYDQLSPGAKAEFKTRIDNAHIAGSISRSDPIRANREQDMSDADKEAFINNFVRGCENIRKRASELAAKNWIEEPMVTSMEYKQESTGIKDTHK